LYGNAGRVASSAVDDRFCNTARSSFPEEETPMAKKKKGKKKGKKGKKK